MGSRIACHFANAGLEVLLLDLAPRSDPSGNSESLGKPSEEQTGRVSARNKTADEALQAAVRSSPSPLYKQQSLRLIKTGNFDDHMRSEEHTSELQSLMRISYSVFCLKKHTSTIRTTN